MQSADRREQILERVRRWGSVRVSDLAPELGCSEMTVRRHLDRLDAEGLVTRTHGGASATRRVRLEFSLYERAQVRRQAKAAIGAAAAELVGEHQRIIIDTGTTTLALAHALRGRRNLSVATTSLAVVSELLHEPGIECMLLGGVVRDSSPDLVGPLLEENLSRLHADVTFVGCDGLSASGDLMTSDPRVARATGMMIANAARAVVLTDSSKGGRNSFITFAHLRDVDCLVTDRAMSADVLGAARIVGLELILADVPDAEGSEV
jgi:DeoR family transcriptional regulator of aga operon